MTDTVRRAGAFAAVGTYALVAPLLNQGAAIPFLAIAALAAFVISDGPLFELFARPGDHQESRLFGLAGFTLAAAGLALLATMPVFGLPIPVFVGAVLLVAYGNLAEMLIRDRRPSPGLATVGFGVGGFVGAAAGLYVWRNAPSTVFDLPSILFLASAGVLLAALLRSVLFGRDDPLVMLSAGLLTWLLSDLMADVHMQGVLSALAVTLLLGYVSYELGTTSIPGMLTGIFLGLLTLVLGGVGWFALLISFFAIGSLSTKFRYEEKKERGVAEENEGARGSGNVLGNSAVALFALLAFAAAPDKLPLAPEPFRYAFAGSVAAAMSDTLSSEIGGVFDNPRLITTFERVDPGTDGGVTWQGEVAGLAGAAVVAVIAVLAWQVTGVLGAVLVVVGGFIGMTVDSVLGATVEGSYVGNQSVNFLATLAGAVASGVLAVASGVVPLS